MLKLNLLGLLSMTVILNGCAKKESRSTSNIVSYQSTSNNPIFINKQFTDCPLILSNEKVDNIALDFLSNGENITQSFQVTNILSDQFVQSPDKSIINNTLQDYNEETRSHLVWSSQTRAYIKRNLWDRVLNEGQSVSVCPGVESFEANTIESASLLTNSIITKTNKAVSDLDLEIKLNKVDVYITPSLKGTYDNSEEIDYSTDNASYYPGQEAIVFLPQSKEFKEVGLFGGRPLWEIPMVASHEYGHHIFASIFKNYSYADNLHKHSKVCFDNRLTKTSKFGKDDTRSSYTRHANFHNTIGALNEGFADLISYYTLDEKESTLKNVTCMEVGRDIRSNVFADEEATKKVFSRYILKKFASTKGENQAASCLEPDFQEIHTIGAVFGKTADRLLSMFTTNKNEKLKILLLWLKELNLEYETSIKGKDTTESLQLSFELLASTALKEYNKPESKEFCLLVNELFHTIPANKDSTYLNCSNVI